MKKIIALLLIAALMAGLSSCAGKKPAADTDNDAGKTAEQVITDNSVYELFFEADGIESISKDVQQKADGTPIEKQIYCRCKNISFQITGYYKMDIDDAISLEIGYVENMTDEEHNGKTYKTRYFTESGMQVAAVSHNDNAFIIEFWISDDDPADYKAFLDGIRFDTAPQEQLDMSLFSLSYEEPAEYEKLSWFAEEHIGSGIYNKSIAWENHDSEGKGAMFSLLFNRNKDLNNLLDSRLEYTETEVNGYPFQKAYSAYTKGHYYNAQVGKDCYLVEMCWQEDENYPPFKAFLDSIHITQG